MKSVCVFCGSSGGNDPGYLASARAMGLAIAARGLTLVYGGGNVGTMGALASAAMEAGARTVGVIPSRLNGFVEHLDLSELVVVADMHERKAVMQERSDAFLAMPGGIGTFEEFFEIWTWRYLGYHDKPVGLLNTRGFYDPMLAFLGHVAEEGFVKPSILDDLPCDDDPERLLDRLANWKPVPFLKYFERAT